MFPGSRTACHRGCEKVPRCVKAACVLSTESWASGIPHSSRGPSLRRVPGEGRDFSGQGSCRVSWAKGSSGKEVRVQPHSRGEHLGSWAQGPHPSLRCLCQRPPQCQPPDPALPPRAALRVSGTPPPPWCSCSCGTPCHVGAEGPCSGLF